MSGVVAEFSDEEDIPAGKYFYQFAL